MLASSKTFRLPLAFVIGAMLLGAVNANDTDTNINIDPKALPILKRETKSNGEVGNNDYKYTTLPSNPSGGQSGSTQPSGGSYSEGTRYSEGSANDNVLDAQVLQNLGVCKIPGQLGCDENDICERANNPNCRPFTSDETQEILKAMVANNTGEQREGGNPIDTKQRNESNPYATNQSNHSYMGANDNNYNASQVLKNFGVCKNLNERGCEDGICELDKYLDNCRPFTSDETQEILKAMDADNTGEQREGGNPIDTKQRNESNPYGPQPSKGDTSQYKGGFQLYSPLKDSGENDGSHNKNSDNTTDHSDYTALQNQVDSNPEFTKILAQLFVNNPNIASDVQKMMVAFYNSPEFLNQVTSTEFKNSNNESFKWNGDKGNAHKSSNTSFKTHKDDDNKTNARLEGGSPNLNKPPDAYLAEDQNSVNTNGLSDPQYYLNTANPEDTTRAAHGGSQYGKPGEQGNYETQKNAYSPENGSENDDKVTMKRRDLSDKSGFIQKRAHNKRNYNLVNRGVAVIKRGIETRFGPIL